MKSPDRKWFAIILAVVFIASISLSATESTFDLPIAFGLPILLFAVPGYVYTILAIVVALLSYTLINISFTYTGDTIFGLSVLAAAGFSKKRFYIPMAESPFAPFIRARFNGSIICYTVAILSLGFLIFRNTSSIAHLAISLGYCSLGRYLQTGLSREEKPLLRQIAGNLGLFSLGIVLALAILELGSRLFVRIPLPPLPSRDVMQWDSSALWTTKPSVRFEYPASIIQGRSEGFTVTHSAAGSRGPEIGPKAKDEFRIVMLGDSYTYGWGVNDDQHVGAQLQRLVETCQSRPVVVINLGVAGYSPWQEFERLKQWGMPLKPDLVVLQLFPCNDIPDSLMRNNRALPTFGDEPPELMRYWRNRARWDLRLDRTLRASCSLYNTYRALWPRNRSAADVLGSVRFFEPPRELFVPIRTSDRISWIEVMLKDWYPLLDDARHEFEQDVLRIVQYCQANNLPILTYALPAGNFDKLSWDALVQLSSERSGETLEYEQFKDARVAEEFFRASNVPWIPVLDEFLAVLDPQSLYIPGDGHLSAEGNNFVATLLFDRLVRDGYIEDAPEDSQGSAQNRKNIH